MAWVGDHVAVGYSLDLLANCSGYALPTRAPVEQLTPQEVEDRFSREWQQDPFSDAMARQDTDEAWRLLSAAAERTLCAAGLDAAGALVPQPRSVPLTRITPHGNESRGVQGLRRLSHRLETLEAEPRNELLRRRVKASLHGLRALVPELPRVVQGSEWLAREPVRDLLAQRIAEEKEATLKLWRRRLAVAEHKQVAWVKQRANQALEASLKPPALSASLSAIHPSSILQYHGDLWAKLWTSSRAAGEPSLAVDDILSSLPQRDFWSQGVVVTPAGLKATAKQMAGKAPGPDSWTAEHFLSLPDRWWEAFSRLWQAILHGALGSTSAQEGCGHTSDRAPADRMEDRRQGGLPSAACVGPLVDHILCVRGGRLVSPRQMPIFASTRYGPRRGGLRCPRS